MPHDIIGDIHGQAGKRKALLKHLGYREHMGAWRHPERSARFVGDLIDRDRRCHARPRAAGALPVRVG